MTDTAGRQAPPPDNAGRSGGRFIGGLFCLMASVGRGICGGSVSVLLLLLPSVAGPSTLAAST